MEYPGIVNTFSGLLDDERESIRREASWVLSNIAEGTSKQIEVLLRCPALITKLNQLALTDVPKVSNFLKFHTIFMQVGRESTLVLSNALKNGNLEQIRFLVENKVIETMVGLLDEEDSTIVVIALECLKKILLCGIEYMGINQLNTNPFLDQLRLLNAIPKIEQLQEHQSDEVCTAALAILEEISDVEEYVSV